MSSWFGNGISQLTGQISNFTKEVLTEGTEEIDDHATHLKLAKNHILEIEALCSSQKSEIERLTRCNTDLEEKLESSELQINAISSEYRNVIQQKETEIQQLQHHQHALLEGQDEASTDGRSKSPALDYYHVDPTRTSEGAQQHSIPTEDLDKLQVQIQALQTQLSSEKDTHQVELAALQDVHAQKISLLKKRHKEEIKKYKLELEDFQDQVEDEGKMESSDLKILQGQILHLEEINHKQSTDLQHLHAANKQSTEELYACQKQLKQIKEAQDKVEEEKKALEVQQQSLLDNLDAITKDNQNLKLHIARKTDIQPIFEASTPIKQGASEWKNEDIGDGTDDSIVSDFNQQSHRIDNKVHTLQQQVENYERDIEHFEMVKSDWLMEKEALEEVLLNLREQMRDKEEALSIAQAQQGLNSTSAEGQNQGQGLLALEKHEMESHSHDHLELDMDSESQDIEDDIEDLNHQVDLLTRGSARLENEHDILVIEKDSLLLEVQEEKTKVEKLQQQLIQETESKKELEDTMEGIRLQLGNVESQLNEKQKEIKIMQEKTDKKTGELQKEDDSSEEVNIVKEQLQQTKSQLAEVLNERDSLMESMEELDTQHQQALQQILKSREVLQKKNKELENSLQESIDAKNTSQEETDLSKELVEVKEKYQQAQREKSQNIKNLTTLQNENDNFKKEINEKNTKLNEVTIALNELHMDKKELQDAVFDLKKQLQNLQSHSAEIKREKKELEITCSQLETQILGKTEELKLLEVSSDDTFEIKKQKGDLENEFKVLQGKLELTVTEKNEIITEISSLKGKLDLVISEKQQLELKVENITKVKDQLVSELQQSKNEIEKTKKELEENTKQQLVVAKKEWEDKLIAERNAMVAIRESVERELSSTEQELKDKVRHYETYIAELEKSRDMDTSELQTECERVMKVSHGKDGQISKLEGQLQQIQSDMEYNKDMLQDTIDGQSHITNLLAEKDAEIDVLKSDNRTLQETSEAQENVIKQNEAELNRLNHIEKLYKQLTEEMKRVKIDLDEVRKKLREKETEEEAKQIESKTLEIITVLEKEITSLQEKIDSKDEALNKLNSQISELNKNNENKNSLLETCKRESESNVQKLTLAERSLGELNDSNTKLKLDISLKGDIIKNLENTIETLKQSVFTKDSDLKESSNKNDALTHQLNSLLVHSSDSDSKLDSVVNQNPTVLSYNGADKKAVINYNGTADECDGSSNGEGDQDDIIQINNLKQQIEERDSTICLLKDKNSMLTNLLEERSKGINGDATLVDIHNLESEVRALRMEKEQMMQVLNDKTRECSQLKVEVHKLMNVVSAEKAALSKLQQDNQQLKEHEIEKPNQDMGKEAIKQLSRMIRDKDLEIESLGQKNTTLLQVLQESSPEGTQITGLIQEKDNLVKQISMFQNDREQIVAALSAKHHEAVSYHSEIQRLNALISEENQKQDLLQQEYSSLLTQYQENKKTLISSQQEYTTLMAQFQEKKRALIDAHKEIAACKEKYAEANSNYKELLEQSLTQSRGSSPIRQNTEPEKAVLLRDPSSVSFVSKYVQTIEYTPTENTTNTEDVGVVTPVKDTNEPPNSTDSQQENKQSCDHIEELQNLQAIIRMHEEAFEEKDKVIMDKNISLVSKDNVIAERDRLLDEKDKQYSELSTRFHKTEQMLRTRDSEIGAIRKQNESLNFKLRGIETEVVDLRQEKENLSSRRNALEQQMEMVKEANNKLSMALKDHAFELNALKEKNNTLTRLLQEKGTDNNEKGEMDRLMKETETLQHQAKVFKIDADQFAMALQQQQEENRDLKSQFQKVNEREQKLSREVERLRSHLMQVEEGYTRELLDAEEREKDLRNRLAAAEERALSASSSVDRANLHASKQVESVQQQLQEMAHQRDQAVLQHAAIHEQATQYASQLSNLQMVLEQFQQEKDQQQAAEIEHYLKELATLRQNNQQLNSTLHQTQMELEECKEALEAAQRLSEQLDRKEEMVSALREEVQVRERQLNEAEDQITALNAASEARIEKALARNLILGYFHTPTGHKNEAIQVLASALDFTHEELQQLHGESSGGWFRSIFKKPTPTPPTTPRKTLSTRPFTAGSIDKSFSELFVTFLEKESSPQPQIRLPAEQMAREQQEKHHRKPAFNPFTAAVPSTSFASSVPTDTSFNKTDTGNTQVKPLSISVPMSSLYKPTENTTLSSSSHLLSIAPLSSSLPLFTASPETRDNAQPPTSAVLKQVLQQQ